MRKILPALGAVILLSGCGFEPLAGATMTNLTLAGATIASYSVLGQSPVDYALSQKRGKYCDFRNMKKYGSYCIEPEPLLGESVVYCYRTLGTPDCTNVIDPHNNGNQPIVGPTAQAIPADYRPQPLALSEYNSRPVDLTQADRDLQPDRVATPADTRSATDKGDFK